MRKVLLSAVLAVLMMPVAHAYAFSDMGEDCSKCHKLSKEDAVSLLKDFGQINVLDVTTSPSKGMWEVDVDSGGRKGIVYIDYSKKYLFSGSIFDIKKKENLTQKRMEDLSRVDVSQIPLDDALVMGAKDAKYRIIVFDDPD